MIMRAEIEVSDNATWQEIEDAKLSAKWKKITTLEERMSGTNLKYKCGGCEHFKQEKRLIGSSSNGKCLMGYVDRIRSHPACKKHYKEREDLK